MEISWSVIIGFKTSKLLAIQVTAIRVRLPKIEELKPTQSPSHWWGEGLIPSMKILAESLTFQVGYVLAT